MRIIDEVTSSVLDCLLVRPLATEVVTQVVAVKNLIDDRVVVLVGFRHIWIRCELANSPESGPYFTVEHRSAPGESPRLHSRARSPVLPLHYSIRSSLCSGARFGGQVSGLLV